MSDYLVTVENLARRYPASSGGAPLTVFDNVNFGIRKGEFICIIGHSGCGKSTILNILAGLDQASAGVVIMDGREVAGPSLDRGVIFQNHTSVAVEIGAQEHHLRRAVPAGRNGLRSRCWRTHASYVELVGLQGAEDANPPNSSGGMRQRVGIARAFAIEPKLLLMDEPFGALDALTRGMIQEELVRIWARTHQTVFMITHDVDESILLADRVLLMTNGPHARVAESVTVDIPRPRDRSTIIHHPSYYVIRNHLVDFLVRRSKELSGGDRTAEVDTAGVSAYPREVNPTQPTVGHAHAG